MEILVEKRDGYCEPFSTSKLAHSIALVYLRKKKFTEEIRKKITLTVETLENEIKGDRSKENILITTKDIVESVKAVSPGWFKSIYCNKVHRDDCVTENSQYFRKLGQHKFAKMIEREKLLVSNHGETFINSSEEGWKDALLNAIAVGQDVIVSVEDEESLNHAVEEVKLSSSNNISIQLSSNNYETYSVISSIPASIDIIIKVSGTLMMQAEDGEAYNMYRDGEVVKKTSAKELLEFYIENDCTLSLWDNVHDTLCGINESYTFDCISPSTGSMMNHKDEAYIVRVDIMKCWYEETKTLAVKELQDTIANAVLVGNELKSPHQNLVIAPMNLDKLIEAQGAVWGSGKAIVIAEVVMNIFKNWSHYGSSHYAMQVDETTPFLNKEIINSMKFKAEHFPEIQEMIAENGMYNDQLVSFILPTDIEMETWEDFRYPIEMMATIQNGCDGAVVGLIDLADVNDKYNAVMYAWKCGLKQITLT